MALPLWALALGGGYLLGSSMGGRKRQDDLQAVTTLTPEQQRVAASIADLIGGNLGRPLEQYGGPYSAGMNIYQLQALGALSSALSSPLVDQLLPSVGAPDTSNLPALPTGASELQQTAQSSLSQLLSGNLLSGLPDVPEYSTRATEQLQPALSRLLSGEPAYQVDPRQTEALFQQAVAAPTIRQFQEEILPAIQEQHVGTGTLYSTMRAQAEAREASRLASELAAQRAQWARAEQEAARQAAESAANRAAGLLPSALAWALESQAQPVQLGLAARSQLATERLGLADALTRAAGQAGQLGSSIFEQALAARGQLASELFRGSELNLAAREQLFNEALNQVRTTADLAALLGQLGGQQQQLETEDLRARYQEWLRTRPENSPYLELAMRFLGEPMMAYYQPAAQLDPLAQLLQVGAQYLPYLLLL